MEPIFAFVVSLPAEVAYVPIAKHIIETLCGLHIVAEDVGPDNVVFDIREDRLTALNAMMPKVIMAVNYGVSIRVGRVVVTPPPIPPPILKTLPLRADGGTTGQDAINLFRRAFGAELSPAGTPWYIVKLMQSWLSGAGIFTTAGRAREYTVPPYFYVEDMLGLDGGAADRQKLLDALK